MVHSCRPRFNSSHDGISGISPEAGHSGNNLASNITHPKANLLIWQVVNEERDVCGNITHASQNESTSK